MQERGRSCRLGSGFQRRGRAADPWGVTATRPILTRVLAAGLGVGLGFAPLTGARADESSLALFDAGRPVEARAAFRRELRDAERAHDPAALWSQWMLGSWLEASSGEPRRSLDLAARALELAVETGDDLRVTRSLCALGGSAASLGLHALGLDLFDRAIGRSAPGGRVEHGDVWELASREKAMLLARTGRVDEANTLLETTTAWARVNRSDLGVAEGAAQLADLAIRKGDLRAADDLADEALRAAMRCDCRAITSSRARLAVGKAALARAQQDPRHFARARERLEEALRFAEDAAVPREAAEAKRMLARAHPPSDVETRAILATDAYALLTRKGSEPRDGAPAAREGAVLLAAPFSAADRDRLARAIRATGAGFDEDLLQRTAAAFAPTELAELDRAAGDGALVRGEGAVHKALEAGEVIAALEGQEALSLRLAQSGYALLSLEWTQRALATVDGLLRRPGDAAELNDLLARKAVLAERRADQALALVPPTQDPVIPARASVASSAAASAAPSER